MATLKKKRERRETEKLTHLMIMVVEHLNNDNGDGQIRGRHDVPTTNKSVFSRQKEGGG